MEVENYHLHLFARAAIMKYCRLGGINNKNSFSHDSGGWKSEIKVPASLVSPGTSLLGLQMGCVLSLCPHWPFLCVLACPWYVSLSKFPLLVQTSVLLG